MKNIIALGPWIIKKTTLFEAEWSKYLSPNLFCAYKKGWLIQKRLKGLRLDDLQLNNFFDLLPRVAHELGVIHKRCLLPSAPKLRSHSDWYANLYRLWGKARYCLFEQEWAILHYIAPLLEAMEDVSIDGVFKDANPGNWILCNDTIFALDYGSMSIASFASDFAQLLDYITPIDQLDDSYFWKIIREWAKGFGTDTPVGNIRKDLPVILMYSALCRVPFHNTKKRYKWYSIMKNRVYEHGWTNLVYALEQVMCCLSNLDNL